MRGSRSGNPFLDAIRPFVKELEAHIKSCEQCTAAYSHPIWGMLPICPEADQLQHDIAEVELRQHNDVARGIRSAYGGFDPFRRVLDRLRREELDRYRL